MSASDEADKNLDAAAQALELEPETDPLDGAGEVLEDGEKPINWPATAKRLGRGAATKLAYPVAGIAPPEYQKDWQERNPAYNGTTSTLASTVTAGTGTSISTALALNELGMENPDAFYAGIALGTLVTLYGASRTILTDGNSTYGLIPSKDSREKIYSVPRNTAKAALELTGKAYSEIKGFSDELVVRDDSEKA